MKLTNQQIKSKIKLGVAFWVESDNERKDASRIAATIGKLYTTRKARPNGFYVLPLPSASKQIKSYGI